METHNDREIRYKWQHDTLDRISESHPQWQLLFSFEGSRSLDIDIFTIIYSETLSDGTRIFHVAQATPGGDVQYICLTSYIFTQLFTSIAIEAFPVAEMHEQA